MSQNNHIYSNFWNKSNISIYLTNKKNTDTNNKDVKSNYRNKNIGLTDINHHEYLILSRKWKNKLNI